MTEDTTAELAEALRHGLVCAAATPMDEAGRLRHADLDGYASAIASEVDGVCVWAHTGRGLHLSDEDRHAVLAAFRSASRGPVVAAVGPPVGTPAGFDAELAATVRMAERAAEGGADGLMVYPVSSLRAAETRTARTLALHQAVAEATGLPVIGFLLYERAGGTAYDPGLLTELASQPWLVGVKIAALFDAMLCQDAITAVHSAGALAITGEDRMFGPSLMWGADAALVGIAAAAPHLSREVVRRWFDGDSAGFLAASARLDRFACAVFREPMDGYVQRMLWTAQREGILPAAGAHDPHGVRLDPSQRAQAWAAYDAACAPGLRPA